VISIQFSDTSLSNCRCSSSSKNLVSRFLLTPWVCSLSYPSCGDVICGISCLCSFNCLPYEDVICGTVKVCLTTCTIISIIDGSTLPLIIFCAFKFVLFCSLFTLEPKTPLSSTLFFHLKALFREFLATFSLFFGVVYISSLVLLTLAGGFYGLSF
jgi:hypothetical protein